jgi:AcrR family transcriptional regulator
MMAPRFGQMGDDRGQADAPRSRASGRERILDAAEALFAERGIDGATVSAITAASGARNKSAVAYHFGTKLDLLEAVLARHLRALDDQRDAMVARLEQLAEPTLDEVVDALVLPVAAQLEHASGVRYLQIQAMLLSYPGRASLPAALRDPSPRFVRFGVQLRRVMGDRQMSSATGVLLTSLVFHGLADFARTGPHSRRERDEFVAALTAAVAGIVQHDVTHRSR